MVHDFLVNELILYIFNNKQTLYKGNISDELKSAKWYKPVDMSELVAKIINKLNYDKSIASYMDATRVIRDLLEE